MQNKQEQILDAYLFFAIFQTLYLPYVSNTVAAQPLSVRSVANPDKDPFVLGLPDPRPDLLVTSTDLALDPATAPDPSIIKQNSKKNIDFYFL
jgi:hypothetical protein